MINEFNLSTAIEKLSHLEQEIDSIPRNTATRGRQAATIGRQAREIMAGLKIKGLTKLGAFEGCLHQLRDDVVKQEDSSDSFSQNLHETHAISARIQRKWENIVSPQVENLNEAA